MDDFKNMLEKQLQKAKANSVPVESGAKALQRKQSDATGAGADAADVSPMPAASAKSKESVWGREKTATAATMGNAQITALSANLNRVTVNLFDADRRALAVIKEKLSTAGHDFTNRSDSIKVALRIAAKAKREELVQAFEQVKGEDRRFKNVV